MVEAAAWLMACTKAREAVRREFHVCRRCHRPCFRLGHLTTRVDRYAIDRYRVVHAVNVDSDCEWRIVNEAKGSDSFDSSFCGTFG